MNHATADTPRICIRGTEAKPAQARPRWTPQEAQLLFTGACFLLLSVSLLARLALSGF